MNRFTPFSGLETWLRVMFLLVIGVAVGQAQITLERRLDVNKNVPEMGTLRTAFSWTNSGFQAVSSVALTLSMSSSTAENPISLGDFSATLRHGVGGSEGFRSASLFSMGGLTNLTQTFIQPDNLDGSWLSSGYWNLALTDGQSGGVGRLDAWTLAVTGTLVNSGTLDVGGGGVISATSAGTQEIGAVVSSSGSGANAVALEASSGRALQLNAGLNGSGEFKKQGEGAVRLAAASTNFTGAMKVQSGELEVANSGALGSGSLDVSSGAKVRVAGGVTLSNALAVASGQAVLAGGTNSTDVSTVSSVISGSGGIEKIGAGRLVLTGTNTYSGATDISEGKLVVNGNIASSSKVTVETGGTLGGSGTVGVLEIASGGTLAVGNSPGTLNAGNTTWAGGASLAWEVDDSTGNETVSGTTLFGRGSNWDFLNVTGTLNITATSTNKFIIDVISLLNGTNTGDTADGFAPGTDYSFAIATASGGIQIGGTGIGGYASESAFNSALLALFDINTTAFMNNQNSDALWSISTASGGTTLLLSYSGSQVGGGGFGGGGGGATAIPEPSSASLVVLGLAAVLAKRRRDAARG